MCDRFAALYTEQVVDMRAGLSVFAVSLPLIPPNDADLSSESWTKPLYQKVIFRLVFILDPQDSVVCSLILLFCSRLVGVIVVERPVI